MSFAHLLIEPVVRPAASRNVVTPLRSVRAVPVTRPARSWLLRPGTLHGAALKAAEKGPRMSKIGTLIRIVVALSLLLAAPANAQNVRFHDRAGRVTGSARTDANGVTTFYTPSDS